MFVGMLYFIGRGWSVQEYEQQQFYIITTFIAAIAFTSYFAMATGFGLIEVVVGEQALDIYWARYADWLFTTPLLLLDLALLAGADRNTIATLLGLDVLMIGTGAVGALATTSPGVRIAWWGISSAALVILLYVLVGELSAAARRRTGDVIDLFTTLRNLTIGLWVLYPVVWLLGTESTLGLLPLYWETAAFMVLDLSAKVGFGIILLRSRSVLEQATAERGVSPA
jgi:bacteriorhodopsin